MGMLQTRTLSASGVPATVHLKSAMKVPSDWRTALA